MEEELSLLSKTSRILLRSPQAADDVQVTNLRNNPISRAYLPFFPAHATVDDIKERRAKREVDSTIADFNIYVIENGRTIFAGIAGIFDFSDMHNSCEVGIMVDPELYGQNVATDALYTLLEWIFEKQGIHRVTFETSAANIPMRHWLENIANIRLEADRKGCWRSCKGEYLDVKGYAVLESEWSQVKDRLECRLKLESIRE